MLDDFKTELKRLGIRRIQKEEERRRSYALVVNLHDEEKEDPTNFMDRKASSSTAEDTEQLEFGQMLKSSPAPLTNGFGNRTRKSSQIVGKAPIKVSRLPRLGRFIGRRKPPKELTQDNGHQDVSDEKMNISDTASRHATFRQPHPKMSPVEERLSQMRQSIGAIEFQR